MKTIIRSTVQSSYKRDHFIFVPKKDWGSFPPLTASVELDTDIGTIRTQFYAGSYRGFSRNLKPWFDAHPDLRAGDTLIIIVEQGRKYRIRCRRGE